jgi:transcriptional regulator with GAF, ATPase, and Fis domain
VRDGHFREDLYYRLNVFPVRLPALRERREDIGLLATAFAQKFARRMGRVLAPLSEDCRRRLETYSWPGNVRELQNVLERAVITARDGRIDLDRALQDGEPAAPVNVAEAMPRVRTARELEALERQNIIAALDSAEWKIAGSDGAAQLLGVKPTTLSSRIKALGIERKR